MGDEEYPASVVGVDRDKDVAVLQLKMPEDVDMKVCSLIRKDPVGICQVGADNLWLRGCWLRRVRCCLLKLFTGSASCEAFVHGRMQSGA